MPSNVRFKLDLFLMRPENFEIIYLIRTGSKEFSPAVMGHAKHNTPCQSESSYFEEHGLQGKPEGYLVNKETSARGDTRGARRVRPARPRIHRAGGSI